MMDVTRPLDNTLSLGWPSCCHIPYWKADGQAFFSTTAAFSFLGINNSHGYHCIECHLQCSGIINAFAKGRNDDREFISLEAFVHLSFGGHPPCCVTPPSHNVKELRKFILDSLLKLKLEKEDSMLSDNMMDPSQKGTSTNVTSSTFRIKCRKRRAPCVQLTDPSQKRTSTGSTSQSTYGEERLLDHIPSGKSLDPAKKRTSTITSSTLQSTQCSLSDACVRRRALPTGDQYQATLCSTSDTNIPSEFETNTDESNALNFDQQLCGRKSSKGHEKDVTFSDSSNSSDMVDYVDSRNEESSSSSNSKVAHYKQQHKERATFCSTKRKTSKQQLLKLRDSVHPQETTTPIGRRKPIRDERSAVYNDTRTRESGSGKKASSLVAFQRPNFDAKRQSCTVCKETFILPESLASHLLSHVKADRPTVCPVCARRLSSVKSLHNHINVHVGYKEFECDICLEKFHSNSGMYKHKTKQHCGP